MPSCRPRHGCGSPDARNGHDEKNDAGSRPVARRCEYCRLHEDDLPVYPFHIEHIVATKHGGGDGEENLAWSCHYCNLAKSSNLAGIDPATGDVTVLFNPRRQDWTDHFEWNGPVLTGRTPSGRATIAVLNINAAHRVALRALLITGGTFPPKS